MTRRHFLAAGAALTAAPASAAAPLTLTSESAGRFARLALSGVTREFPHKLDHVINDAAGLKGPRALHPAFYGCFDWHSAVHGHWLLARILRLFPGLPEADAIRAALIQNLTTDHIAIETAYLSGKNTGAFERTYGWAWLLKLAEELSYGASEESKAWAKTLQPLTDAFVERYLKFLPKADYPIRTGVHPNTAFGLAFAHDYARRAAHEPLRKLVEEKARAFFLADRNYPVQFEPSGEDFFSPALLEADLMRRLLPRDEFEAWFERFLPPSPGPPFIPAKVSDRSDLKIVHLDGLNLSRAWCFQNIARALPATAPVRPLLEEMAKAHTAASLPHVTSGDYAGEHWLASFAMLVMD